MPRSVKPRRRRPLRWYAGARIVIVPFVGGANRIAELLSDAREKLGLSAEQAAADAGIPLQYVRLLEGESAVPVGVADEMYLIPFFRRYATFVGLDAVRLLPEFLGQVRNVPAAPTAPVPVSYRSWVAGLWKPAAVIVSVVVAVLLLGRQSLRPPPFEDTDWGDTDAQVEETGTQVIAAAPNGPAWGGAPVSAPNEELAAGISPPTPAADPSPGLVAAEATPSEEVPELPPVGHQLRVVADEETWLSIGIDDQPKKSLLMQPGDAETLAANETFTLTVGNAGGVSILLDGRELPRLGRSGQVVRNLRLPETATPSGGDQ